LMISPHVRRHRLASELIKLREEHGYSTQRLATTVGIPRQRISQLQNGHLSPDLDDIIRILDVFKVGERRWELIMAIARDAQGRGWWENYREEMGPRQALIADLEAGARSIVEYQMTLLPGLLVM
jgi:transcriptional regulator with XRE-family HTH domain